jgi:hypothetical protein
VKYKVYYCIYDNDESVDSEKPIEIEKTKVMQIAKKVCKGQDNFMGFEDTSRTVIQFYVKKINTIWFEIPVLKEKGSYGTYISQVKMMEILENLSEPFLQYKQKERLKFKPFNRKITLEIGGKTITYDLDKKKYMD